MPNFGTKSALFGYFCARIFKKTIVIFKISTLKFGKYEFLTHTVNVGISSAISKGPGFAFLKIRVRVRVHLIKYACYIE